jgi:hypothetical protein
VSVKGQSKFVKHLNHVGSYGSEARAVLEEEEHKDQEERPQCLWAQQLSNFPLADAFSTKGVHMFGVTILS